jgi:xanthine dehydrogenase accessory factor
MHNVSRLFSFLQDRIAAGERTALVTITDVTGASVRNPGAHVVVAECGAYLGSLSGGCIESAVVTEAIDAIRTGEPREVRYGAGSPIIDIRLPCGGSVNVLFNPVEREDWISAVCRQFTRREEVVLRLPRLDGGEFNVHHAPPLRIVVAGHGGSVEALYGLGRAIDAEMLVLTPDEAIARRVGVSATLLHSRHDVVAPPSDRWTAVVFFFHDHDWEVPLLGQAIQNEALYIGAMGSRLTHGKRMAALADGGANAEAIARIRSPIGIIPSSRDPETLALSTLTEIVNAYNEAHPTRTGNRAPMVSA